MDILGIHDSCGTRAIRREKKSCRVRHVVDAIYRQVSPYFTYSLYIFYCARAPHPVHVCTAEGRGRCRVYSLDRHSDRISVTSYCHRLLIGPVRRYNFSVVRPETSIEYSSSVYEILRLIHCMYDWPQDNAQDSIIFVVKYALCNAVKKRALGLVKMYYYLIYYSTI